MERLLEKKSESEKLYNESVAKVEELKKRVKDKPLGLKGTVLYSVSPMMGFNSKTLPGEVLELLGVENITNELTGERPIIHRISFEGESRFLSRSNEHKIN